MRKRASAPGERLSIASTWHGLVRRFFGFTVLVLVDESYVILSGHGRVLSDQALGLANVPTRVTSGLSDSDRRTYVIANNKLALLSN